MIALVMLFFIFLWVYLGYAIWKKVIYPRVYNKLVIALTAMLMITAWLVGPILDEILGAREFERRCAELPPATFYGPIELGSGDFFDENGKPRWSNESEFDDIDRKSDEAKWESKSNWIVISEYPMPIGEYQMHYFAKKTGKPIVLSRTLISSGGWLRRTLGLDVVLRGYICRNNSFPGGASTVIFKKD